jgi:Zn-dependent protease
LNFKFLKIPVYIDLSFWIFLLLVMGTTGGPYRESLLLAIVIALSLLTHEYGHALAALFFGTEPIITLYAFGGKTEFNKSGITGKQDFLITLAGPLLQGFLILIAYSLLQINFFHNYYIIYFLLVAKHINIIWLLLNLIPLAPLDGGWLVRYILEKKFGRKGYRASIMIGLVAAAIAIPYLYFRRYHPFLIIQLLILGFQHCKLWQEEQ